MRYCLIAACFLLSACTDSSVQTPKTAKVTKENLQVHGAQSNNDSEPVGFISVVKKMNSPTRPDKRIGELFDTYPYLTDKKWKETKASNGNVYVDYLGFYEKNKNDLKSLKDGIHAKGIEVKFVITPDGVFFVGLVNMLVAKTNGQIYREPAKEANIILAALDNGTPLNFKP